MVANLSLTLAVILFGIPFFRPIYKVLVYYLTLGINSNHLL